MSIRLRTDAGLAAGSASRGGSVVCDHRRSLGLRRALMALVGSYLAIGLLAVPAAAATTRPLTMLKDARSRLSALSASANPSAKAALSDAVAQLDAATADSLWSDPSDAVPPPPGDEVFTGSAAAVADLNSLQSNSSVSQSALRSAHDEIIDACGELANAALRRAGLAAQPDSGGQSDASVGQDQAAYDRAFQELGKEITQTVTSVPQRTVDQAAKNFLRSATKHFSVFPQHISGPTLTADGKPELFYYGAEFCPYCAVNRWSMVAALAQFGEFSPLSLTVSSTQDMFPSTNSFTFYGSGYDSSALAFDPVEGFTNQPCSTCGPFPFANLQTPTPAEQQLINQHDPYYLISFLDVADRWRTVSSYVDPTVIQGLSWEQIAHSLADPSSAVAQYIDGGATILAAQLCTVNGEHPTDICDTSVNRQYQQLLMAAPTDLDPQPLIAVSCASTSLCVAVDVAGNALVSHNPAAATPTWSAPANIDGANYIAGISCPSTSLCVAVDGSGNALVSHNPAAATPTWSAPANIDGANFISAISCPSTSLCVAVDGSGNALVSHNPAAATPTWSAPANIDGANYIAGISCPSTSLCVAVDGSGNALVSHNPAAATPTWSAPANIDGANFISAISCPSTSLCVAVDGSGNALVSHNPAAATPTWSAPANIDGANFIAGISCPSTSLCVAVDAADNALISDNAGAPIPTWSTPTYINGTSEPLGVSCPSTSLCAAVDLAGNALVTDDPSATAPTWSGRARLGEHSGTDQPQEPPGAMYSCHCRAADAGMSKPTRKVSGRPSGYPDMAPERPPPVRR